MKCTLAAPYFTSAEAGCHAVYTCLLHTERETVHVAHDSLVDFAAQTSPAPMLTTLSALCIYLGNNVVTPYCSGRDCPPLYRSRRPASQPHLHIPPRKTRPEATCKRKKQVTRIAILFIKFNEYYTKSRKHKDILLPRRQTTTKKTSVPDSQRRRQRNSRNSQINPGRNQQSE